LSAAGGASARVLVRARSALLAAGGSCARARSSPLSTLKGDDVGAGILLACNSSASFGNHLGVDVVGEAEPFNVMQSATRRSAFVLASLLKARGKQYNINDLLFSSSVGVSDT
jgi:hypothetical protein